MTIDPNPVSPLLIGGLVGMSIGLAVDVAMFGHPTWRTPVWACVFLIGFWYNHNYGRKP
jgi:hypothetical protein